MRASGLNFKISAKFVIFLTESLNFFEIFF